MNRSRIFVGAVLLLTLFAVVSCDHTPPHEHEFVINHDKVSHWQECQCGERTSIEEHLFVANHDEISHWKECSCGEKTSVEKHSFNVEWDETGHRKVCQCGETIFVEDHVFATRYDEINHWKECSCGKKVSVENHAFVVNHDEASHWKECSCGNKESIEEHTFVFNHDEDNHWQKCSCGYKADIESHSFGALVFASSGVTQSCACGYTEKVHEPVTISSEAEFFSAVEYGVDVILKTDVLVASGNVTDSDDCFHFEKDIEIDLNGHTLAFEVGVMLDAADEAENAYKVLFSNGRMESDSEGAMGGIVVSDNALLHMEGIDFYSKSRFCGIVVKNSSVEIVDSKVFSFGSYGLSSDAGGDFSGITIRNSMVSTGDEESGDNTAIFFGVQNGYVEIYDSTIVGDRQAVVIRCGKDHFIENSTLKVTGLHSRSFNKWSSGNEVPNAALVVGNGCDYDPYKSKTFVGLHNAKFDAPVDDRYYAMFVYQLDSQYPVSVSGSVDYIGNNRINLTDMNGASLGVGKVFVRDKEEFVSMVSGFSDIWLADDIDVGSMDWPYMSYGKTIELNGYSLSYSKSLMAGKTSFAIFRNGTLNFTGVFGYGLVMASGAKLLLDNVKYNSNDCGINVIDDGQSRSTMEILNGSAINAKEHGIFTSQISDNDGDVTSNITIYIADSTITTKDSNNGDNSAIIFGVKGSLNIENSTIIADRQAVVLRGGEGHVIKDSNLIATGNNSVSEGYLDKAWGDSNLNQVPLASLVIGNRSESGYKYPTSVGLENVKLSAPEKNSSGLTYYAMYVCQNDRSNTVKVEGSVEYMDNLKVNLSSMNAATFAVDKVYVENLDEFRWAFNGSRPISNIVFLSDIDATGMGYLWIPADVCFNLNGKTLTSDYIKVDGAKTVFRNGNLIVNTTKVVGIELTSNSKLCLDNVEYRTSAKQGIATCELVKNVQIDVLNDSKVFANVCGIVTNAYVDSNGNFSEDIRVNVNGSSISTEGSSNGDDVAILFNVKGSVCIEDSEIIGDRQAVILRGGEGHVIRNSTLRATGNNEVSKEYLDGYWGSGNEVPLAALVIGNRSVSGYRYPTSVTLDNAKLSAPEKNNAEKNYFAMYVYQSERMTLNTVTVEGLVIYVGENSSVNSNMNGARYEVEEI